MAAADDYAPAEPEDCGAAHRTVGAQGLRSGLGDDATPEGPLRWARIGLGGPSPPGRIETKCRRNP